MLNTISPFWKEELSKSDLWNLIIQQEEEIEYFEKRVDSLIDLLKDACAEGNQAINYWKKNYNDAINMAIGYKNSCIEWRHRCEDLQDRLDRYDA